MSTPELKHFREHRRGLGTGQLSSRNQIPSAPPELRAVTGVPAGTAGAAGNRRRLAYPRQPKRPNHPADQTGQTTTASGACETHKGIICARPVALLTWRPAAPIGAPDTNDNAEFDDCRDC
jgi:hypothetical protein